MEKIVYIATIVDKNCVEVYVCDAVPDFVHAVKYDSINNVEIYFSADAEWTPVQEDIVIEQVSNHLCVASEIY
jgi:hypothetical protein